jgi:predicted DNA binding CopG/RHH family protein
MHYIQFCFLWLIQKVINPFLPSGRRKSVILIDIPQPLLNELKVMAAMEGLTISGLIEKILKEVISKKERTPL